MGGQVARKNAAARAQEQEQAKKELEAQQQQVRGHIMLCDDANERCGRACVERIGWRVDHSRCCMWRGVHRDAVQSSLLARRLALAYIGLTARMCMAVREGGHGCSGSGGPAGGSDGGT